MDLIAGEQCALAILITRQGGEGDRGNPAGVSRFGPHPGDELVSVVLRHADITDDDIQLPIAIDCLERFGRRGYGYDLSPPFLENSSCQYPRVRLVIDDENAQARKR